jgi:hypothetical protein
MLAPRLSGFDPMQAFGLQKTQQFKGSQPIRNALD